MTAATARTWYEPMKAGDLPGPIGCLTAAAAPYLNDRHAAEPKLDGNRVQWMIGAERSVVRTARGADISANLPHLQAVAIPGLAGMILDGELVAAGTGTDQMLTTTSQITGSSPRHAREIQMIAGPARLYLFDVLAADPGLLDGDLAGRAEPVTALTYRQRRQRLEVLHGILTRMLPASAGWLHLVPQWDATPASIARALAAGYEGLILKAWDSPYLGGEANRGKGWIKVKAACPASGVVTGWKPGKGSNAGLVGSLEVSLIDDAGALVPVGHVGNMTLRFRRQITVGGALDPAWLDGRHVIEFIGQGITGGTKIRHCRMVRVRPDQALADCRLTQLDAFPRV